MDIENVMQVYGDRTRVLLHQIEAVIERIPGAREALGNIDLHEERRALDYAIAQSWAAGVEQAAVMGEARAAFLTVAAEWSDASNNARTSLERMTAKMLYSAFCDTAARYVPETPESRRYHVDFDSPAARSFFGDAHAAETTPSQSPDVST